MPQDLIDRLDALIATQAALAEAIGRLAQAVAMMAGADDEREQVPTTLDG
jgi:hypothetical protein